MFLLLEFAMMNLYFLLKKAYKLRKLLKKEILCNTKIIDLIIIIMITTIITNYNEQLIYYLSHLMLSGLGQDLLTFFSN